MFFRRLRCEPLEPRLTLSATVRGTVWDDANGNGVQDYGELGVAGVSVFLDLNDDGECQAGEPSTLTRADDVATPDVNEVGSYLLAADLLAGPYTVRHVLPSGSVQSFPAPAAPLRFIEALSDGQTDAVGNPVDRLAESLSVAVSPDGLHVYAAAHVDDAVTVFRRDSASGRLTVVETLSEGERDSWGNTLRGLDGAWFVALSPDGRHVYVAAPEAGTVTVFQRDAGTGRLRWVERLQDGVPDGQGQPVDGLRGVRWAAVSPDGGQIYTAGFDDDAVGVFAREASSGRLTFLEALSNGSPDGQGTIVAGLDGAISVAVSPDGGQVYVAGYYADAVAAFQRDGETGRLAFVEMLKDGGSDGSGTRVDGLDGVQSVTVSADGRSAYLAGSREDEIAVFARDAVSGRLSCVQLIDNPLAWGLDNVRGIAVSLDGAQVYAVGWKGNSLSVFDRDAATGRLEFQQLLADGAADGRGTLVDGLGGAHGVAVSPDGRHVLVAAGVDSAVSVFELPEHAGGHRLWLEAGQQIEGISFGHRTPRVPGVLYMRLDFPDKPGEPVSEGVVRAVMATVNGSYIFNSYGKQSFPDVQVTETLRMPREAAYYAPDQGWVLRDDAKAAAIAAGYDVAGAAHLVFAFRHLPFGYAGLAAMPGRWVMLNGSFGSGTLSHELKHNLGVGHSFFWDTADGSVIGPGVKVQGQLLDGSRRFMAYWKVKAGWLDRGTQVADVAGSGGRYTLHGIDLGVQDAANDYALAIAKDGEHVYWVEFRPGLEGNPYVQDGVCISWRETLLDMTPGSASGKNDTFDSPLLIGQTFSDAEAGIHITPVAKHDAPSPSVDVVVHVGQFPDNRPPVAAFTATRLRAWVGETVTFADLSTDPDGQPLANFWSFGDGTWQTSRPQAGKSWSQPGQYEVELSVTDMYGGTATVTQAIVVESPSTPYLRVAPQAAAVPENAGSGAVTATLMRGNADLDTDLTVTLASSDPSELALPPQVTIPAGVASAVFFLQPVDDDLLDGTQTVSVTATAAGFLADAAQLVITDHETLSLTVSLPSIGENAGLEAAWGTVTRSNTDGDLPLTVTLQCADPSEILVPATVEIPAGASAVSFPIAAVDDLLLDGTQTVTVTALADGYVSGSADVEVGDHETLSVEVSESTMPECGGVIEAQVVRSNADNDQPLTVNLTSSDTSELAVPAQVTIPAGAPSAAFQLTAVDDAWLDGTQPVTVWAAAAGYVSVAGAVEVTDWETLSLHLAAERISENGGAITTTVTRSNLDRDEALTVDLFSDDTSEALVPSPIVILAGEVAVAVEIVGQDDPLVDGPQWVTISAAAAGFVSAAVTLEVTDDELPSLLVETPVAAFSELAGAGGGTLVIRRNRDTETALLVTLTSSDPSEVRVPASVTIPAGEWSVEVVVDIVNDGDIDGRQTAIITASAPAWTTGASTLDILDDDSAEARTIAGPAAGDLEPAVYQVLGDLIVEAGTTLSVAPASEFRFAAGTRILVQGRLLAQGATDAAIHFTSGAATPAPGDWRGVRVENAGQPRTVLAHVEIAYALTGLDIVPNGTHPLLSLAGAEIHHNSGNGVSVATDSGQFIAATDVELIGNHIHHNGANGVYLRSFHNGCHTTGNATTVAGNEIEYQGAAGIYAVTDAGTGTWCSPRTKGSVSSRIAGNYVHHNYEGIYGRSDRQRDKQNSTELSVELVNNLVVDNTTYGVRLVATSSYAILTARTVNNTIAHNGGAGLFHSAAIDAGFMIRNNVVAENADGIAADAACTPPAGSVGYNDVFGSTNADWVNYPAWFGDLSTTNARGTPADLEQNLSVSPQFMSAVDFHLAPESWLVSAGAAESAPADDFDHDTRVAPFDIGFDEAATLTVRLSPEAVREDAGATAALGTVERNTADLSVSLSVSLASSDPTAALVPAVRIIPAGAHATTFPVEAVDDAWLDGTQTVTVTASAVGYVAGDDLLLVSDYETLTLTLAADFLSEDGETTAGTVRRSNTDVGIALDVALTVSDPTELTVPQYVTIPAGQASFDFPVTAVYDGLLDGTQSVTVTASATGYAAGSDTIDVTDGERLTVTVATDVISERDGVTIATVARGSADLEQALAVSLTADDATGATVPPEVIIPAYAATATFLVTAVDDSLLDGPQTVTVTAAAPGYIDGGVLVTIADFELLTVSLVASSISESGGVSAATVTRHNTDTSDPLTVLLVSDDVSAAIVPAAVTIPPDEGSATFSVWAVDDDILDGPQTATVRAVAPGYEDGEAELWVTDNDVLAVSCLWPADGAADVVPDTELVITFNADIQRGSGALIIRRASDHALVETIAVSSPSVTVSGRQATVEPSAVLAESTAYYVQIEPGTFQHASGSLFAGIDDPTDWDFMVGDFTAPPAPEIAGITEDTGTLGDGITSAKRLSFYGWAEGDTTVQLFQDGDAIGATIANVTGSWLFDYTSTILAAGTYLFTAQATDAAGNTSPSSAPYTVVVDLTPPLVTVDPLQTRDATPAITGAVADGTLQVAVNGKTYTAWDGNLSVSGTTWTLQVPAGDALPWGTYNVAATATDAAGNVGSDNTTDELRIVRLIVTSLTPTPSGFVAQFSGEFQLPGLNLYDGAGGTLGAADVILKDSANQVVAGSLVVDESRQAITFVKTAGVLTPDTYTVTVRSGAPALRDMDDDPLDGNNDGATGDDFTASFTVASSTGRVVSIPDIARGAGQSVNSPNTTGGLPLRLDNADGVTSLALQLIYDQDLLDITAAALAAGLPAGWSVTLDPSAPGVASIRASGTTALSGTDVDVVRLTAAVPGAAPYGAVQAIRLENVSLNSGVIGAVGDVAVHKAVYLGDADGSGIHSSADAFLTVQAALGLASGFAAHAWTDPRIVGDADGSGVLSAADAFLIVQEGLGLSEPFVPDNPHISVTPVGGGVDPQFQIGVDVPASAGGVVSVPVKLDVEAAASNVGAIDFDLFFDPSQLTIQLPGGVSAGADTAGWAMSAILVAPGQLRVAMVSSYGQPLAVGLREIARLQFGVEVSRTGWQPVRDGLPTRPTWLDIEPVDARAGGYTWTEADGSVLIRPAEQALAGATRERVWRDVDAKADVLESVLADLVHEIATAWR